MPGSLDSLTVFTHACWGADQLAKEHHGSLKVPDFIRSWKQRSDLLAITVGHGQASTYAQPETRRPCSPLKTVKHSVMNLHYTEPAAPLLTGDRMRRNQSFTLQRIVFGQRVRTCCPCFSLDNTGPGPCYCARRGVKSPLW